MEKYFIKGGTGRQLRKPLSASRVCITVSNSPNSPRVYMRLCKHGKSPTAETVHKEYSSLTKHMRHHLILLVECKKRFPLKKRLFMQVPIGYQKEL